MDSLSRSQGARDADKCVWCPRCYWKLIELANTLMVWNPEAASIWVASQVREVVEYAAQRFITVVPEIELPGHCRAALACYTHLSCALPRLCLIMAAMSFGSSCFCTPWPAQVMPLSCMLPKAIPEECPCTPRTCAALLIILTGTWAGAVQAWMTRTWRPCRRGGACMRTSTARFAL